MSIVKPLNYFRLDPFYGIKQIQDFGDFLWDTVKEISTGRPAMNVYYDENKAILEAELPGVKKEDLEIETLGNTVTIKGLKDPTKGDNFIRSERSYGKFSRNIQLPFDINTENVEATLQRGMLTITLPRKAEDKPKKVQISAE